MPEEDDTVMLKLNSGYVLGFEKKTIKKVELIIPHQEHEQVIKKTNSTASMKPESVVVVNTGGTISSKVDYKTGAVVASFDPNTLISLFPELSEMATIETEFVANIMSDNFRLHNFNLVAQAIHKRALKGQTKFIVTCGTDFLHYASAALSFLLKDLPVSVIVVGSQRSSDRPSTDAASNLINAVYFLQNKVFQGVLICMHSTSSDEACNILPGVNVRKMHSSRRDAFKPINSDVIALVDFQKNSIMMNIEFKPIMQHPIPDKLPLFNENLKIGLVYSHPQFYSDELSCFDKFDGLVLAGSGFGHFPVISSDDSSKEHTKILKRIAELAKKMPVVMTTQTISGQVNLNVYTPLRMIQEAGVLGHLSTMITETTYIKLAYLLSTAKKSDVPTLLMTNMLGELDNEKYFSFQNQE